MHFNNLHIPTLYHLNLATKYSAQVQLILGEAVYCCIFLVAARAKTVRAEHNEGNVGVKKRLVRKLLEPKILFRSQLTFLVAARIKSVRAI